MVIGTGIDIIEVGRIANASSRPAFMERLFTDVERSYFRLRIMIRKPLPACRGQRGIV